MENTSSQGGHASARGFLSRHKRLLVSIAVAAVLIAIVGCMFLIQRSPEAHEPYRFEYVAIESALNTSVDPCEDFYDFACGNWESALKAINRTQQKNAFDLLQPQISAYLKSIFLDAYMANRQDVPKLVKNALQFYGSCIKTIQEEADYSATLKQFFKELGGFPVVEGSSWNEENFSLEKYVAMILQNFELCTFPPLYISIDDSDSSRSIIIVGVPEIPISEFDLRMMIYFKMFHSFVVSLGSKVDVSDTYQAAWNIVDFLTKFSDHMNGNSSSTKEELLRVAPEMTIQQLQDEVPDINWLFLMQTVCGNGTVLSKADKIKVLDVQSLKTFFAMLREENVTRSTLANVFAWMVFQRVNLYIPKISFLLFEEDNLSKEAMSSVLMDHCYDKVSELYFPALDVLYLRNMSNDEKSGELVHLSKEAFKMHVSSSSWLDKATKNQIFLKVDNMFEVVGYPKAYANGEQFGNVTLPDMGTNVIENYMRSARFCVQYLVTTLKTKNNFQHWLLPRPITAVGAYYYLQRNAIVFTLSLQNPPMYYRYGPQYLNYGGIGYVIGHEINHGFDNMGHLRNKYGSVSKTWTDGSIAKLHEHFDCFIEQFNNYTLADGITHLNGRKTLGENMADSSGIRQAYSAYQLWIKKHGQEKRYNGLEQYTADQMLFISYASLLCTAYPLHYADGRHSPKKLRVNGALANSEDFSRSFGCKLGSPMNPVKKCIVW